MLVGVADGDDLLHDLAAVGRSTCGAR
jgi:hypothetical protein